MLEGFSGCQCLDLKVRLDVLLEVRKMSHVPEIIPVSDLRQGAAELLGRVRMNQQPVIITQRGRAAAVLVSVESYEEAEREREILKRIARGEREIKSGRGHDLASVMAEADRLLNR